jgi:hypothetical protein
MTLTESVPMFSLDDMPPILYMQDRPRVHRNDPLTSHLAGDVSQLGLTKTKARVLELVTIHQPVTGTELNDLYRLTAARLNWPTVAWDSPRKRAGEMAADGVLEIVGAQVGVNGQMEAAYKVREATK